MNASYPVRKAQMADAPLRNGDIQPDLTEIKLCMCDKRCECCFESQSGLNDVTMEFVKTAL